MKKYLVTLILAATSTLTYAGDRTADQLINYFEEQRQLAEFYQQRECRREARLNREAAENAAYFQWAEHNRREQQAQQQAQMAIILQLLGN